MERLKIAFVGTAHPHSKAYLETIAHVQEVQVTAILENGGAVDERFAGAARFQALDALIAQGDFAAAFVFLPNDEAAVACRALAAAGKHIFCEKPVCRSAAEMKEVAAAVREAGVAFCTGYQWRVHPISRYIKDLVAEGFLGTVHAVEARLITTTVAARNPEHYLFDRKKSGGGIVNWLGCHHIDLLRFLLGQEVTEVTAMTATVTPHPIDVEDVALAALRFSGGALGSLAQGYLIPGAVSDAYMKSPYDMFLALRGDKGWVRWDPTTPLVEVYSLDERWAGAPYQKVEFALSQKPGYGWGGYEMVRRFARSVRTGEPTVADAEDAMQTLAVIDAIYRSAASRKVERPEA